ncbi:MAG: ABC transporter permease [Bacteroidetes bacterium 47-18]|nr:MAG: ABC transporter permease [Bacteroidetes bacterium 47-18]
MLKHWWKALGALLVLYGIIYGLAMNVPKLDILNETIRNVFFHVPMWFTMTVLFVISVYYAIMYLAKNDLKYDIWSSQLIKTGLYFGCLGMLTGMLWARSTWGAFWSNDPKQVMTLLSMLIYFAYVVLRTSITDLEKRARISAVFNVFAFALMIPLIWILPRLTESLHPGTGGDNPAFGKMAPELSIVFRPVAIGWILMGLWIATLFIRTEIIKYKKQELL